MKTYCIFYNDFVAGYLFDEIFNIVARKWPRNSMVGVPTLCMDLGLDLWHFLSAALATSLGLLLEKHSIKWSAKRGSRVLVPNFSDVLIIQHINCLHLPIISWAFIFLLTKRLKWLFNPLWGKLLSFAGFFLPESF